MNYERLKKFAVSLCLSLIFILSSGFASTSLVQAQDWRQWRREQRQEDRWERERRMREEREEMWRIRQLDRDRQLRFRFNNSMRTVGYYDFFGRFHAVGYYDQFGFFHRY